MAASPAGDYYHGLKMASKAVVDAFEAQIGATWSGLAVVGTNTSGESPSDGSSFIIIQFPVSTAVRITVNTGRYFEEGAARFVINMQRGDGLGAGLTKADALATLFRDVDFGGVETFVPSPPIIDDTNEDGNYYAFAVIVPYRYEFT